MKLDALIELCKIGITQAAAALGTLLAKEVTPDTPRLRTLAGAESQRICGCEQATAVRVAISGSWGGTMLILLGDSDARIILGLLLGETPAQGEPLSELQRSALMEIGNIMGSAFLNAVGAAMKTPLLPSTPTLHSGVPATILRDAARGHEDNAVVEAQFSVAGTSCSGSFLLVAPGLPAGGGPKQ